MAETVLYGYERKDGYYGIRNYVVVISVVHCAQTVAEQIANATTAACVVHEHGCTEAIALSERTFLGLARAGQSPNVFGVLLVGLGCEQIDVERLQKEILKHTDHVAYISIQEEGGPPQAVAKGVEIVRSMQMAAAQQTRKPMPFEQLVVGVQCGGSDWTTALAGNTTIGEMTDLIIAAGGSVLMGEIYGFPGSEHIVAEHAVNRKVGLEILHMIRELREDFIKKTGYSIESVNPTPGNKAGGITTLVEKSMGNIKKMGTAPIQGILQVGERPPHPGLWIVDNRKEGVDSYNITGFALARAHAAVFSSGRGTPVGNAVMPIIKITGNSRRYEHLKSMFDFNSGVVMEGADLRATGRDLMELLIRKLNGEETRSEINGNREYTSPYGGRLLDAEM